MAALNISHHFTGVTQKNKRLLFKLRMDLVSDGRFRQPIRYHSTLYQCGIDSLLIITTQWNQDRRKVKHCLFTVSFVYTESNRGKHGHILSFKVSFWSIFKSFKLKITDKITFS